MDRRIFTKTAFASVAGIVASGSTSVAAPKKHIKQKFENVQCSDEAEEQIKVIQSRRYYKNQRAKVQGKCASLLFFADVHLVSKHLRKIAMFYRKHKKFIDDPIHLGDSVGDMFLGNFSEFWNDFPEALNIIGNHDCYIDKKRPRRTEMSDIDKFKNYFAPYIDGWRVVQPSNAQANGKCYWHKDYQGFLRVIGVDCMRMADNQQFDWFIKNLADAKAKNLMVLIATHIPPNSKEVLECNFNSLDYAPHDGGIACARYISAVDSFISDGGMFVAWIAGHDHCDKMMYARGSKNKQLVVVMECATDFSWWTDAVHVQNTATETCWEIISVESHTNVLKIARFGNNYDHYLRHKGTLCYDFKNHKLISQS